MQRKCFGPLPIFYLPLFIVCSLITWTTVDGNAGVMKLCPAGGESFTTAWHLACAIKKKRSIPSRGDRPWKRAEDAYRPLSMTEMMEYCCKDGCTIRDLLPYCDPFGGWDS